MGLIGLATVAALLAVAVAQSKTLRPHANGKSAMSQWHKELGLSAVQSKKVEALRADSHKKTEKVVMALREQRQALGKFRAAEKPDAKRIQAATKEIETLRAELRKAHVASREALAKVLTADQRKKLANLHPCGRGGEPGGDCPGECDEGDCDRDCGHGSGIGCDERPGHGCGMGAGDCPGECDQGDCDKDCGHGSGIGCDERPSHGCGMGTGECAGH